MKNEKQIQLQNEAEQVRRRRGLSLDDIAKETGISKATLSRFFLGRGSLSLHHFEKLERWARPEPEPGAEQDTIGEIHRVLHSDTRLKPIAKKALCDLMEVAYAHFSTDEENQQ